MMRKFSAVILTAAILATGCSSGGKTGPTQIEAAARKCALDPLVADEGQSITLRTSGKEGGGNVAIWNIDCMLKELKAPTHVRDHIDSTRALDGQQVDTWPGFQARWTYHPDSGLRLTIIEKPAER